MVLGLNITYISLLF